MVTPRVIALDWAKLLERIQSYGTVPAGQLGVEGRIHEPDVHLSGRPVLHLDPRTDRVLVLELDRRSLAGLGVLQEERAGVAIVRRRIRVDVHQFGVG
jgi:hypothetical protein